MKQSYIKLLLLFVALAILLSLFFLIQNSEIGQRKSSVTDVFPITDNAAISIKTRDKNNIYYRVSNKEHIEYNVEGPGVLRVITRYDFEKSRYAPTHYRFWVRANQDDPIQIHRTAKRSYLSRYENENEFVPGKIRNARLNIPEGIYRLKFYLDQNAPYDLNFRLLMEEDSGDKKMWVFAKPDQYTSESLLMIGDRKRVYYPVKEGGELRFRVQGPTQFRMISRWEINQEKIESKNNIYLVKIHENDLFKSEHMIDSMVAKNVKMEYPLVSRSVFGRRGSIVVNVPEGEHEYSVTVKTPDNMNQVFIRPFTYVEDTLKTNRVMLENN